MNRSDTQHAGTRRGFLGILAILPTAGCTSMVLRDKRAEPPSEMRARSLVREPAERARIVLVDAGETEIDGVVVNLQDEDASIVVVAEFYRDDDGDHELVATAEQTIPDIGPKQGAKFVVPYPAEIPREGLEYALRAEVRSDSD